jgi:hypothetical protein
MIIKHSLTGEQPKSLNRLNRKFLCSETAFRQHNIGTLRSVREAVSRFSHFLYFPHTFYICHNCSESSTHRRDLLCELLQRQSVRTRHHSQSIHFAEQLVEAVARGLCHLQRLSLQQFVFEYSVFHEAVDVSSDVFAVPLSVLCHFCCQPIDEDVNRLF